MKLPPKPKKNQKLNDNAVIYARYSSHNQKDMSIEQQLTACKALAEDFGLTVIDTYEDRAISGKSDNRPAFQKMMKDAESGRFRYVLSWKSSRIGRNMMEALVNESRLNDCGVRICYAEEDFEDNAAGRFAARSMMNMNQFYSEAMAEDIRRGLQSNADKCLVTGAIPFGYKVGPDHRYEIDEPKAEIVRDIFSRVVEGESLASIARDLNDRGIKTQYGNDWNKGSFHRMLANERYKGVYIYQSTRTEDGIPRIISDDMFRRAQEAIKMKNNSDTPRRRRAEYLLTGKLFCGECGEAMVGISGTSKQKTMHYYYACKGKLAKTCDKKNVKRDSIEQTIAAAIVDNILVPETMDWIADRVLEFQAKEAENPEIEILKNQLVEVKASIANIMRAIEMGIFTPTTKDRLLELEAEQRTTEATLQSLNETGPQYTKEDILKWLSSFKDTDCKKKKQLQALFDSFLSAAYLYDDGRLRILFDIGGGSCEEITTEMIDGVIEGECSYSLPSAPPLSTYTNPQVFVVGGLFILTCNVN